MHLFKLVLLTFPIVPFLTVLLSNSAQAACVDTDVSLQLALRSQNQPASQQTNVVESNLSDDCFGNVATTTNNQVYFGDSYPRQTRSRYVEMDTPNGQSLPVNTPNIQTGVGIQMDVPLPLDSY